MTKWIVWLALVVGGAAALAGEAEEQVTGLKVTEQVVFFYYSDLSEAAEFYESVMGFEETLSMEWVKIYRTTGSSSVGIVDEKRGFLSGAKDKPVMLSLVTDDVDSWHRHLEGKGIEIQSPPADNAETGIRAFVFTDPGGYSLEFFEWLEK